MSQRDQGRPGQETGHSEFKENNDKAVPEAPVHVVPRRRVLGASVGVGLGFGLAGMGAEAAKSPARERPQPGDLVVFRFGDNAGQPVTPDDVPGGEELLQVITKDPSSGVVRDGTRLNGINLVRVDPSSLDPETRDNAAGEVVAFSSVCTHQGCDLTQWLPDTNTFKCYCHYSQFNAVKNGEPEHGPATRRLAMLPIKVNANGHLEVAGRFSGKVGFK